LLGASFGAHYICREGAAPNLNIGAGISHIFEAGLGETFGQKRTFIGSLEINSSVAGVNFVEETEIAGNALGELAIGGGSQHDAASCRFFLKEKVDDLLAIGKTGGIEMNASGELPFKSGFAG
jgi:hypothetical protein